ncbi:MAG: glycosyltransferase [Dorea sp.]|nr:glycosyltransferase [Dorea sp.]
MLQKNKIPEVSVICPVYNQEKYIRRMLDGLLMQETTFPVEFLIHDDASPDSTVAIIKEYVEKDPERFILSVEPTNTYALGIDYMPDLMTKAPRGKYLAFCEGDDYFTDPHKLQKQYEAMEAHPECSMCIHQVEGISEDETKRVRMFPDTPFPEGPVKAETIIHESLGKDYWLIHTTCFFIRKSYVDLAVEQNYDFLVNACYTDQALVLLSAMNGDFYYIDACMTRYRFNSTGSTIQQSRIREKQKRNCLELIRCMESFDQISQQKYHSDVEDYVGALHFSIANCELDFKKMLSKDMRKYLKRMRWYARLRVYISAVFPYFDTLYYKIRKYLQGV